MSATPGSRRISLLLFERRLSFVALAAGFGYMFGTVRQQRREAIDRRQDENDRADSVT